MSGTFIDTGTLSELFPGALTIMAEGAATKNQRGATVLGIPVVVLDALPSQIALAERGGEEVPGPGGAIAISTHTIICQNYHPQITEKMWGVLDGQRYNILHADRDPMKTVSILKVRKEVG